MTQQSNQDELIEYVTNPDNLKKAAEGSMEKRQALLDNQELPEKIDEILNTDYYDYADDGQLAFVFRVPIFLKKKIKNKLLDLIEQEKKNELQNFLTKWEDTNSEVAYRYIKERISQLQSKKGNK